MFGTIYHIIPFVLVRAVASRMDQPGKKTISTHRMLVGVPLYLVWYVAVTCVLVFYQVWMAWASLIAGPFTGLIAVHYWRETGQTMRLLYHQLRVIVGRRQLKQPHQQLSTLRARLVDLSNATRLFRD